MAYTVQIPGPDDDPVVATRSFARRYRLSERETAVLTSAVRGACMKETAQALQISLKTVECYWSRIYEKLGERSQLTVLAKIVRWMADPRRPES